MNGHASVSRLHFAQALVLLAALLLGAAPAHSQPNRARTDTPYLQPNVLQLGLSLGVGGQQLWAAPSVDVHYGDVTLRTVPGPFAFGAGVQVRLGPRVYATDCVHRPVYISAGYLNDWALSPLLRGASSTLVDQQAVPLMVGLRRNLNPRGTTYAEVGVGLTWVGQLRRAQGEESRASRWMPMLELRLGLIQARALRRYGRF